LPLGFSLLLLSGISQLIKCIAFLRGQGPDPHATNGEMTAEEALAAEIREMAEAQTNENQQKTTIKGQ